MILLLAIAALLLAGGVALSYVIGATAVLSFVAADRTMFLAAIPQKIVAHIDNFTLMSMPLFILAGEIMNRSGVTQALLRLAMLMFGGLRGGLGHVNVATSVFFAGISGSAVADAASLSNMLVPQMRKEGYRDTYAAAITAASSVIGPIIPPSIVMIFYGALMGTSVAGLFVAGFLPGLLLAAALMLLNAVYSRREGYASQSTPMSDKRAVIRDALPALLIPVIIIGGIVFGIVTPTEAATLSVFCALIVGRLYGPFDRAGLFAAFRRTAVLSGSIFLILSAVAAFGYLAGLQQLPTRMAEWLIGLGFDGWTYLLLLNVVFLIAGMFLEVPVALALLVPLLAPTAVTMGVDPVHLGIVICLNLTIGMASPPFGACLIIVSTVTGVGYWRLCRAVIPFVLVEIVILLIVTYVPGISMVLPRLFGYAG
ncbi:TRAP transporter large permease subunit [Pseudooceanicola sp. 216_PA32_1]|uniref:TRAP transporter large permease protein n=1 Tax=Pseudooceanicola pacificus TaxID=2676438 RepID=A0A844W4L9_9RHOB|nr:TRAP transporter large permease [Pseudooceanicola pacificus]MWB78015.1 TRAP transporter large permease subunit [Pseudooceanicola pacificus]